MASRGNYKTVDYYQAKTHGVKDGFEAFSDQGMYYFTCNKNGEVFIISEGYTSSSARNRGIQSVAKNLMLATQYNFENLSPSQYYFILKAGNNQEIAKSKIFETEDAMHAFVGWIIGKRFSVNLMQDEEIDENLQISQNGADSVLTGIYSNQADYFIFKGTNGKQYFSFKNKVGKTLLLNNNVRGYDDIATVNKILAEVLQFAPSINNYDFKLTKNGKYYFYLKNTDLSNIAKSTFFASEDEMMEVIDVLTLVNVEVSISDKNKQANTQKTIDVQSGLFSEIDDKTVNKASEVERLANLQASESTKEVKQKPVEVAKQPIAEKSTSSEDEFTASLKKQQQAELEVRLKIEKEEKDRKDEQNKYAQANAAVLRKHKEEQSLELDGNLKKDNIVKANVLKETPGKKSTPAKKDIVKQQVPTKKVKVEAPKIERPKIVVEPPKPVAVKTEQIEVKTTNKVKKPKLPVRKKEPLPKKQEQPIELKKVVPKEPVKSNTTTKQPSQKNNDKKGADKPGNADIDYELEKKKIANQERFEELKRAAEGRKRKEKEAQANQEAPENKKQTEKDSYDWWTKKDEPVKDEPAKDDFILDENKDVEADEDKEPINLTKMLKPALIALMVLALIFVGFRSFKSSSNNKKNAAVATTSNNNAVSNGTLVNGTSAGSNAEKNYSNATLPASFADFEKGSIEWHMINCIVDDNCAQQQNFQWLETNFQQNATYVSLDAIQSIDNIAKLMKEYANTRLEIYGHIAANEKDNFKSGKSLSEVRAKQIQELLTERGIPADRLSYKGLAKTRPIQAGKSLTANHQNKRTELVLFKQEQSL